MFNEPFSPGATVRGSGSVRCASGSGWRAGPYPLGLGECGAGSGELWGVFTAGRPSAVVVHFTPSPSATLFPVRFASSPFTVREKGA